MTKISQKIKKKHFSQLNLGLAVFSLGVLIGTVFFIHDFVQRNPRVLGAEEIVEIAVPEWYQNTLVVSRGKKSLSITPLAGERAPVEHIDNQYIYKDAYPYTDVVQTKDKFKLKEELVFKQPRRRQGYGGQAGHPIQFQYRLGNIENYHIAKNQDGHIVFYDKASYNPDQPELSRVFTIPRPYLKDSEGVKSFSVVQAVIEGDVLTITLDQNWLQTAQYPVTLDPAIEINVLNVHSHPQQGDNWEVSFTTQGQADLKIIPADQATIDDDEFVSLSCDDKEIPLQAGAGQGLQILDGDVIYYPDWHCQGIGKIVHYTKKAGQHTLKFDFGGQIAWAYNDNGLILESGSVDIDDSLEWTAITLTNTYTVTPVILVTPVTAVNCAGTCSGTGAGNGGMYPVPLVRNVTTSGFDISMCVDGGSVSCSTGMSTETLHWFAFDASEAYGYDWIEVGTTTNVATNGTLTAETYTTSFVAVPDVWTQAQTYSQGGEIGAHAWVIDGVTKTTSGFNYTGCVHTGIADACDADNPAETFGYVAIDTANQAFDASLGFQTGAADISNSAWTAATFTPNFTTPRVMVTQNDDDGGQDPQYAWARNVTTTGMDFRYCEEDAGDLCNSHNAEMMYWFAIEEPVAGNNTPTIISVSAPSVRPGSDVSFTVSWDDDDSGEQIKVKICKTNSLTGQNCTDGWWASSTAFTTSDPVTVSTTTVGIADGTYEFWAFVCDDDGACSDPYYNFFQVAYTTPINNSLVSKFTSGLVGHWTFNGQDMNWGSSTAEALDRSGQDNHGDVINDAKPVIGKVGQALEFDGSDDYVDTGNVYNDAKTVSFWLKPDSMTEKVIDLNNIANIDVDSGTITAHNFTDPIIYVDGAVSSIIDTNWHNVSVTTNTGINATSTTIGKIDDYYFDGILDEVRIYNRALDASEVLDLYRAGARVFQVDPTKAYKTYIRE